MIIRNPLSNSCLPPKTHRLVYRRWNSLSVFGADSWGAAGHFIIVIAALLLLLMTLSAEGCSSSLCLMWPRLLSQPLWGRQHKPIISPVSWSCVGCFAVSLKVPALQTQSRAEPAVFSCLSIKLLNSVNMGLWGHTLSRPRGLRTQDPPALPLLVCAHIALIALPCDLPLQHKHRNRNATEVQTGDSSVKRARKRGCRTAGRGV